MLALAQSISNAQAASRKLFHARHWSRRLAMQALYQWQMTNEEPQEIERQFREKEEIGKADLQYFREILFNVPLHLAMLDNYLLEHTDRSIESIDPVERAILRGACYEMKCRNDIPSKVVIDEAVQLARKFGATQSHSFINGVLDKLQTD